MIDKYMYMGVTSQGEHSPSNYQTLERHESITKSVQDLIMEEDITPMRRRSNYNMI